MALLSFKVQSDYEKVVRLREEIAKLETQLKSFGKNTPLVEIKTVEGRLAEAKKEFTALASEAAKAGAVLSTDFKGKIRESTAVVDGLTARIIEQKGVIKDIEHDVKKLGEAWRQAAKSESSAKAAEAKAEYDAARKALDEEKASLFALNQEKAKATLATKKLKDQYAEYKDEAKDASKESDGLSLSLGKIAGLVGGVAALKQLGSAVVQVRAQFQDMETQIETLVGKDVTAKIMPQIKEMAKVSPLTMSDIVGAEKMMLSFNIEAEKSVEYLRALSDVSMGNSQKFNSLTLAFSQMSSAGKLMGQDLLQMINAGFNPLQQISEKTGKSISQLKEEMSKGAISAEMVQQAFIDATSAGGKFYNMSENASKTINGQISMMQDAMDAVFNEIGTKSEKVIIKGIQMTTSLIQNYEKVGQVLASLVATYGVYRTAVLLATAATSKHTLAEIALTNVRIAARKAQQLLNKAMLTNPYVALATVVAGLAAAMWTLRDNTSAAERAQKSYNEYKENAARKEEEHKNAIQKLIDTVRDDANAIAERQAALIALKNEYPNIFSQYDIESLKLAELLDLNKKLNEEMSIRKRAQALVDIESQKGVVQQLENFGVSDKKLDAERKKLELMQKEYLAAYSLPDYVSSLKKKSMEELENELGGANFMASGTGIGTYDGMKADKQFYESMAKAIQTEIDNRKAITKNFGEVYEEKEEAYKTALAEFKWAEENKTKITLEEYQKRKTAKETAEKEFKAVGGDPKEKEEKDEVKKANERLAQQERMQSMLDKNAKANARAVKDNEFMVEQARIDAMKDGHAKTMAQMELDHKKELENLERQKQDYITKVVEQEKAVFDAKEDEKAKNNPKYKKQSFDTAEAEAKVDTSAFDKAIKLTTQKYANEEGDLLKNLYNQYQSYEDKKIEMEKAYLDDVLVLNLAYLQTGDEKYARSLNERTKAYIKEKNNLEKSFNTEDYKLIFGDPSKMTSKTIEEALKKARDKMKELNKETDPESFKALSEAIERLENARDNNPFKGWDTSVMGIIQKLYQIRNIRKDIAKYEEEGNKEAAEAASAQLEASKKDLNKALIGTGVSQFGDALSRAAASMREVAEASGDVDLLQQAQALERAGNVVSSVASGAASGGWIGAIVGGATAMMDILVSTITESKVVAAEAKKAYEDYIDEIAHTARTINEKDYDTIFGVRSLEKVRDATKQAEQAWSDYVKVRDESRGANYSYNYKPWIMPTGLGEQLVWAGKKQTPENAYKVKTVAEMFPELFDKDGNLVMEKAQAILESYSQYSGEQWYEYLSDAVSALKDYEENLAIVDNYVQSLFQNLGSDLADAIMQGDDALEVLKKSTGEIFASIAKQLIYELMISDDFITKYKEKWRKAMATEDYTDDAEVVDAITNELAQNIEAAKKMWDDIQRVAKEKGIDMDLGDVSSQQATSKGYQTLSEDTGNELVGRATAQYESNLRMEESMREVRDIADIMAAGQIQIRDIAAESRALIADSFLELQQIRENTGATSKTLKTIEARMSEWDSKIKSL